MKLKDRIYKIELDKDINNPKFIHIDLSHITAISSIDDETRWIPSFNIYLVLNDSPIKVWSVNSQTLSIDEIRQKLFEAWSNFNE